ncbi:beta-ketoacyl synthase domain-containing protein [Lophiotrema nucula]|uniref:Beta-ketoacyl synthase domain-containing protein n=1 Tax=Lophiotrema nucula TaxID=690887 RepID=A0A6A5ZMG2_9PLEO|nr:beta-ketoacyl synthase domain-containing protein [Lophiotrema nucula]
MTSSEQYHQEPIAIVGFACRLPGGNHTPRKLWDFLERGEIADNTVPSSRFNIAGHYDGSLKPRTMRQSGGMFLKDIDLAEFDAGFFELGAAEATSMDPAQRQMLEVVFEGLENAGIPLEKLDNQRVGCYAGSYAADYADMANRDPEDRASGSALGIARTILANRLSHFLNVKGPSITLDTACSSSLVGLDLACQSLRSGTSDMGIVAAANMYLSPEHLIDAGNVAGAHSPSALCHTFDAAADGYVKAEAASAVIVKRLSDAVRDRDPVRAIVLGTASNHNGRTVGIASPSGEAQALAIRAAYASAGITDFNQTTFLECHGTATQAGDANEVNGIASVFSPTRAAESPLIIGSIKSNVGHAEPAAGLSGILKAVMSIEKGAIPGNPTFINPSPKIDWVGAKVKATRTLIPWPKNAPKRASVNSFGIGGSNAHVIVEEPNVEDRVHHVSSYVDDASEFSLEEDEAPRPYSLVLSANDAMSLEKNIKALCTHLMDPRVKVNLADLAYTLSERRTTLFHRAFVSTRTLDLNENDFILAKKSSQAPKIGFVFTGQGAQWPQMGKSLLEAFPWTRSILEELDQVLQAQPNPPEWSLVSELTGSRSAKHMRQPEISQPLVTALQLCLVAVLESWGIKPSSVVGHSSGECAAAYVAGWLDRAGALKAAFYRGQAAKNCNAEKDVGMLAVGLSAEQAAPYLDKHVGNAAIACFNSPSSLTFSGRKSALDDMASEIKADGHFARALQVDLAYHSDFMVEIGEEYRKLLNEDGQFKPLNGTSSGVALFSSVTGVKKETSADASYWNANMVSPVRFADALTEMITKDAPTILIEVGPSGALAGPVAQVLKGLPTKSDISYCAAWSRGNSASKSLFDVAGRLFATGAPIDMAVVNQYDARVRTVIDLPNYSWNHSVKYWHESDASKDWRFRKFPVHDLLGSKVLGTPWSAPVWRNRLNAANVPWILDHAMGGNAIMPAAGFMTLGLEALYQKHCALNPSEAPSGPNELCYCFRNVRFQRALVVESGRDARITVTLSKVPGSDEWHEFRISSSEGDMVAEHCHGLIRIQAPLDDVRENTTPLRSPRPAKLWYKAFAEIGMGFGPNFQRLLKIESTAGSHECRTLITLAPPASAWSPQSYYPLHPAAFDGVLQTPMPANMAGERVNVRDTMLPSLIDECIVNKVPTRLHEGLSNAASVYSGRGRKDQDKSWVANTSVYNAETGALVARITGLSYVKLDIPPKPDVHTFDRVSWQPDVAFLTQDQILRLDPGTSGSKIERVIDLIANKKPSLAVVEINLEQEDESCLWFDGGDAAIRSAYSQYTFAATDSAKLVSVQTRHGDKDKASFLHISPDREGLGLKQEPIFDLAIVKVSKQTQNTVLPKLKSLLSPDALTLVVRPLNESQTSASSDIIHVPDDVALSYGNPDLETPGTQPASLFGSSDSEEDDSSSSIDSAGLDAEAAEAFSKAGGGIIPAEESASIELGPSGEDGSSASLVKFSSIEKSSPIVRKNLLVASLREPGTATVDPSLRATLEGSGWTIVNQSLSSEQPADGDVVLVLDELSGSILRHADQKQWDSIKTLTTSGQPLLWVTKGAQSSVTDPDQALVSGMLRVAGREDHSLNFTVLDVQASTSPATEWAIDRVLQLLARDVPKETLYMERDGVLHIQRVIPDLAINNFKRAEIEGIEPVVQPFHGNKAHVQLRAERIGTLQSLTWCETDTGRLALEADHVEVKVMAVGVNFKDVAITMGIVPDNEYSIGFECAGIVTNLGSRVTKFNVGDRVCIMQQGMYANRVRVHVDRCHLIPNSMSYEAAATIPCVYLCSLYALYHLANLQEGQSVLIHSATGGVGIACIELAQHKKAEIYVTVGTEEKRKFLESNYGIPRSRMFSSRSTKFAAEIIRETGGRGVDAIVNSLIGELLDASWRIVADGGTMVEIGKRDIVDRNTLAMEPFDRNCSFRAVDFSYTKHVNEPMVARLFAELFTLMNAGHIKPIHPVQTFGFDAVPTALATIRAGRHIGKIVVTNGDQDDITMPIRPAVRQLHLSPDVSYLMVGGLKGLCGTLVVHMARHGARNIVVSNRSGISDEASAKIVRDCLSYGCKIVEARGDIGDLDFVKSLVRDTVPRIAGVIQGAMALRDKAYETMTLDDFHLPVYARVEGTWNLHKATTELLDQPLEFFTLLSSTTGIAGRPGQSNYAAANAFLDAFASYRQQQGLCANSVDLGLVHDVGYVAEDDTGLEDKINKRHWIPINESMLRRIFTYSIFQQDLRTPINKESSAQLVTGIAYPYPQDGSDTSLEPRFSHLSAVRGEGKRATDGGSGSDKSDQAVQALQSLRKAGADEAALTKACVEIVAAQFAKILRLSEEMETGKSPMAYGLDSLSAVEFRNWVRQKLNVTLSTLDIVNASSLVAIGEKVASKLQDDEKNGE